ncbi:ester cyclase [Acidisphaera sp. L21]|uniref:ester cyclase n=1 Tax=Acidisphaera sp. L21 TaxID=1641851 RepID=UPI00131C2747|nr:ester cyclase [Acidisphaera sp. L21]
MHRRAILAGLAAGGIAATARAQPATDPRALAERFAATLSAHDMAAFADLFAEDYRNHQASAAAPPPPPGGKTMKQGSVDFFAARLAGLPDLTVTIEALVATNDQVAASFVYTGTHQGVYFGVQPTGRKLRFTSCDIFTVRDGKLAEHWGMGDIAGVLAQLKA